MSGFIKKVGVTPTRGNGFIIDSFNTNDNKEFNAPSLRAVEDRTDNNLLLCGSFINATISASKVNGWSIEPSSSYSGSPAQFLPVAGLWLPARYEGIIKSPYFSDFTGDSVDIDEPFSVTILYGAQSGLVNTQVAKLENITSRVATDTTLDGKLRVIIPTFRSGGKVWFYVFNISSADMFIQGIKVEKGTTCTDFQLIGKEYGIAGMIEDNISSVLLDRFNTITGTFTTNSNGEASANLAYPSGFSKENCVVLSAGISDKAGNYHYYKTGSDKSSTREYVMLSDGYVNVYYQGTSTDASATLNYRIVLYKF